MNLLSRPIVDDAAVFAALAANRQLKSFPALAEHVVGVQTAYAQYLQVNGDVSLIDGFPLSEDIGDYLKGHYSAPSKELAFIKALRAHGDVSRCPMCGSAAGGSLDHMMPKEEHPVFAVFSQNLVPACKCNSGRGTTTRGSKPGERILHPYFDHVLGERILTANFEHLGVAPRVTLEILTPQTHRDFAAVRFHVDRIVRRTGIARYLLLEWNKLMSKPSRVTTRFRDDPLTRRDLVKTLRDERERTDHDGRNCWDSVFFSGLLRPAVSTWLFERFQRPGRSPDGPLAL